MIKFSFSVPCIKVQNMKLRNRFCLLTLLIICFTFVACKTNTTEQAEVLVATSKLEKPSFSSDSAYSFIEQQIDFGARIPNTPAQKKCADYLSNKLKQYGAEVIVQTTKLPIYNGQIVPCYNIIGSFNPTIKRRLLLCAHWDTRPFSDRADKNQSTPNLGVDDGASGVAVLLEIARQLQIKPSEIGIDIIFFDVEDYGPPASEEAKYSGRDFYALGTQYWCKNPHIANYSASNGILLDMVGARNATFTFEGVSMQYAPEFMKQVWNNAASLGHGKYFIKRVTQPIIDDHYYINTLTTTPTIDIIYRTLETESGFAKHWHTHDDTIDNIDKNTLQTVGETVLATLYNY